MSYQRKFIHYGPSPTTYIQELDSRSTGMWFELLRHGGCGQAEIRLQDVFALRNEITIGDWIAAEYTSNAVNYATGGIGDRWYLGRVESINSTSPAGATLQLYGMSTQLNEVFPGGFGGSNDDKPHVYARSDWFVHDPDYDLNTYTSVSSPEALVNSLYTHYISPATDITSWAVEAADPGVNLDSFVFRGEESVQSILRSAAIMNRGASWGVDELGRLFFIQKRSDILSTFQEGQSCTNLARTRDRSLMYNRLLLTGGYIYGLNILTDGTQEQWTGFYRFRATYHVAASVASHGERRIRIFAPWVRRNADGDAFAREFFRLYAQPTDRYTFTTTGQATLPRPWLGQIALNDINGEELVTQHFDQVRVQFDHVPTFTLTLGPEEVQYPDGPEQPDRRFEIQGANFYGDGEARPNISVQGLGTYTGVAGAPL